MGNGAGGQGGALQPDVARNGGGQRQKGHQQRVTIRAHQLLQALPGQGIWN